MKKRNGSNGVPAWAERNLKALKRATVSLIEAQKQAKGEMVEMRRENHKMFNALVRSNNHLKEEVDSLKEQTATLKNVSDIHTKALLRIVDKL